VQALAEEPVLQHLQVLPQPAGVAGKGVVGQRLGVLCAQVHRLATALACARWVVEWVG
jgi:hypothetical protein